MKTIPLRTLILSFLCIVGAISTAFSNNGYQPDCYTISICENGKELEKLVCEKATQLSVAPELTAPNDQTTNVNLLTDLQWSGGSGNYTVEVYNCNPDYSKIGKINLQNYTLNDIDIDLDSIGDDFSGATYNTLSEEFFYVTNGGDAFGLERIIELDDDGVWKRAITLPGFDDTEGIVWIGGDDYLLIEERRKRVHKISFDENTTSITYPSSYIQLNVNCSASDCIEGISYNAFTNEVLVVNEEVPEPEIYVFTLPLTISGIVNITPTQPFVATTAFSSVNVPPGGLADLAGLHHFSLTPSLRDMNVNDHFLVLSERSNWLLEVDMSGTVHSSLSLLGGSGGLPFDINQPEGVTMDKDGNIYIASEKDDFYKFRNPTLNLNPFDLAANTTYTNTNVSGNSMTIPAGSLMPNTEYCWRVKDNTTGIWSDYQSFTTKYIACPTGYNALIALYNATDGANWYTPWDLNQDMSTWYGVTLNASGCVTRLNLLSNQLTGTIPPELGDLTSLTYLNLGSTFLSGNIPSELGNLVALDTCLLTDNQLTGPIPGGLLNLPAMVYLSLGANQLTGSISDGFGNNLDYLDLAENELTGSIPTVLPNLTYLFLNDNQLSGEIPAELGNLTNLKQLWLSWNELEGNIPDVLGNLPNLITLYLSNNQLDGEIPPALASLSNLTALGLSENELEGMIPASLGGLLNLTYLRLDNNQLTGSIPEELGNLNLSGFSLNNNNLSGCYPESMSNICTSLIQYDNRNAKISDDNDFDADWEDFCGFELGSCQPCAERDYNAMVAFANVITNWGTTTPWDLSDMTMTSWEGVVLSAEGCIESLNFDENNMGGTLPPELGDLHDIESMHLGDNNFIGNIPPELGHLRKLLYLNLTGNGLDGLIPTELSLLTELRQLHLSYNLLDGGIPPELANIGNIFYITVHGNELSGCYENDLLSLCGRLSYTSNGQISNGNNFDADWEDFCATAAGVCTPSVCPNQEEQYEALRAFYLATNGDNWGNNTNWPDAAFFNANPTMPPGIIFANWYGLIVNGDNCVISMNFDEDYIGGTIPPEIGNLTSLEYLDLGINALSGSIPEEIGNLVNLTYLNLSSNNLTNSIPATIGNLVLLEDLYLSYNNFTGTIPPEIGNMTALKGVSIRGSQLEGSIPAELGNLSNLLSINVQDNQLTGTIPASFANLTKLRSMYLKDNLLSGCYDAGLQGLCGHLNPYVNTNAYISDGNSFNAPWEDFCTNGTGACPILDPCVANDRQALEALYNATNGGNWLVSWDLTADMSTWNGVQFTPEGCVKIIYLPANNLVGTLPPEIGMLSNLEQLTLNDNTQISGDIPTEISNLDNLKFLTLSNTGIGGTIPVSLGDLTNLQLLQLDNCQLVGMIPPSLGDLDNLTRLELNNNQLQGEIPGALGDLSNLGRLSLYDNQLEGNIPPSLSNLSELEYLLLNNNQLTGFIPYEFSGLTAIELLTLNNNQMSGCYYDVLDNLCNTIFPNNNINANISDGNNFNAPWEDFCATGLGECPPTVGLSCRTRDSLALLELYYDTDGANWANTWNLETSITDWYGVSTNAIGCVTNLDLSNNRLNGTLPIELSSLSELAGLSLHSNQLNGNIPADIGFLFKLEEIYLYNNNLTGSIPVEFGYLVNLSQLWLTNNQLSGSIPTALGNLPALNVLHLSENELMYNIPVELGGLSNLTGLYLNGNQLTGTIPVELGSLANLQALWLGDNELQGNIPTSFGALTELGSLRLHTNQLTGCYPIELVNICAFADNSDISDGNSFNAAWEDFCTNGTAACTNCPPSLLLDNPLITRTYQADNDIKTESTIPTGTNATLKAGQIITLDKGFSVNPGANLSVEIEDCSGN